MTLTIPFEYQSDFQMKLYHLMIKYTKVDDVYTFDCDIIEHEIIMNYIKNIKQ